MALLTPKFHVGANANETLTVNVKDARAGSLRMARYEAAEVGASAIDGNTALSFRSSDDNFYNVRDTAATDDAVSTTLKSTSAISKAAPSTIPPSFMV